VDGEELAGGEDLLPTRLHNPAGCVELIADGGGEAVDRDVR
jgi:hypothetical protein